MMILVTGAKGQLGSDVARELNRRGIGCACTDIDEVDITDEGAVSRLVKRVKPLCVIHCAAYTAVDKAEDEPELCMQVNAGGTKNIACACRDVGVEMIYVSTDYVFDGGVDTQLETVAQLEAEAQLGTAAQLEVDAKLGTVAQLNADAQLEAEAQLDVDSPKRPLQTYGKSKLSGEEAVIEHLEKHYIVRTSWVFGGIGNNFVKTILRLCKTREEINVVCDQTGSPTYTIDLAALLCDMALSGKYGIYHATNEGFCTWAEFAEEILRISGSSCRVNPISSDQYPTKAMRPKNSRLSKSSLDKNGFARLPEWPDALRRYLANI